MTLVNRIKFLFSSPSLPRPVEVRERIAVRDIVSDHSHGNIFLQLGKFYTKRDVDGRFERIRKVRFAG